MSDVTCANGSLCTQLSDSLEPKAVFMGGGASSLTSYLGGNPDIFLEFSPEQLPPGSVFGHSSPRSSLSSPNCLLGWGAFLGARSPWRGFRVNLSYTVVISDQCRLLHEVRDALLLFVPTLQNDQGLPDKLYGWFSVATGQGWRPSLRNGFL